MRFRQLFDDGSPKPATHCAMLLKRLVRRLGRSPCTTPLAGYMQTHIVQSEQHHQTIGADATDHAVCPACRCPQRIVKTAETRASQMFLCTECHSIFTVNKVAAAALAHIVRDAAAIRVVF